MKKKNNTHIDNDTFDVIKSLFYSNKVLTVTTPPETFYELKKDLNDGCYKTIHRFSLFTLSDPTFSNIEFILENGIRVSILGSFKVKYASPQTIRESMENKIEEKKKEIKEMEEKLKEQENMFKNYSSC